LPGVVREEREEETAAETVRHPLLEGPLLLVGEELPAEVAQHDEQGPPEAQAGQRVERSERIVEEPSVVVDPRQTRAAPEVGAEHLLPDFLHLVDLCEEAMASHVEVKALVGLGAG